MATPRDSTYNGWVSKSYATIDDDYDLVTVRPNYTAQTPQWLPKCIYVGGAGNLAVQYEDGTSDTILGIVAGTILPISPRSIIDTGTTATNVTVIW